MIFSTEIVVTYDTRQERFTHYLRTYEAGESKAIG